MPSGGKGTDADGSISFCQAEKVKETPGPAARSARVSHALSHELTTICDPMPIMRPGELWIVKIGDHLRRVEVVTYSDANGWWLCLDEATGAVIALRDEQFLRKPGPADEQTDG